jgi:hypothetical protein
MPQNFKFVMLLFDCNVEKLQVRPIDIRHMRTYSNKLDEVHFVNYPKINLKTQNFIFIRIFNKYSRVTHNKNLLLKKGHFGLSCFLYLINYLILNIKIRFSFLFELILAKTSISKGNVSIRKKNKNKQIFVYEEYV